MKKWIVVLMLVAMALAPAAARASTTWTVQKIDEHAPFFDPHPLGGASCTSSGFCAVVGIAGRIETTSNATGGSTAWQPADLGAVGLVGIACPSASLCVAVNEETGDVTASTNPAGGSSAWHTVSTNSADPLLAVACHDGTRCVAVGEGGEVLTSSTPATAGSWTASTVDGGTDLGAVSCPSATVCVATDQAGNAVSLSNLGNATPTANPVPTNVTGAADGISCPDTSLCVAVDGSGQTATSTNPSAATPTWTPRGVSGAGYLNAISCASDSLCVAVDNGGQVAVSQNPTAPTPTWTVNTTYHNIAATSLYGISCTTEPLCVAVDAQGDAVTATDPTAGTSSAWSVANVEGTTRLDPGACPTTTLCVIPDRVGKVLTSTNPTGGAGTWTAKDVDGTHQVFGVDCPTMSLCVGVDDAGNVLTSTDPGDGASAAWSVGSIDAQAPYGLQSVSCASSSLCVAVGESGTIVTSTDPAAGASAWSSPATVDVHGLNGPFRVNCPSAQLCVAVDESGNVVTSTNPTGGANAWTPVDIDGTNAMFSVTCHGPSLCVAADQEGNVLSSTNPAGGAGAWSAPTNLAGTSIFGLACPAANFCIAGDDAGNVYSTADPTGGASAWADVANTGDSYGAGGAECASTSLCILSDFQSNIAVGALTPPSVTTGAASALTGSTAKLNGTVNPNGSNVTDCHFEYGTTTSYGTTAPCAETVGDGTAGVAVHADLTGLDPNTTYHVRLDASGDSGPGQGGDVSFTTAAVAPTVTVAPPADVSGHGALLTGDVNPNNANVTDCHFEYGTTTQYGTSVPCDQAVGGGISAVPVSATLAGLALNMTYDFELVATNTAGTTTATGTFDTTAIDTTITSGPVGPTNNPVATFTFTADPAAGATFLCSVDHASPSPCTSPLTTGHLADGNHDIDVRAVTPSGVQDATPAEHDFVVDTVAPRTAVAFAPSPGTSSARIGSGDAFSGPVQVTVSPTDPDPGSGVAQTRCAVDPARVPTSFSALPSVCPKTVSGVGAHVIYAASQDAAGNVETPAAHAFKILAVPDTTITGGPDGPTWDSGPTFTFTSTIPGSTFRCRIDSAFALYTACSSPYTSSALGTGSHTIQVAAISPDGVGDPTPAVRTFSVNPPESHSWECHINPYTALSPYSTDPDGCEFATKAPCEEGGSQRCILIGTICPTGARCALTGISDFDNADQNAEWALDAATSAASPTGRSLLGQVTGNCDGLQPSGSNCHRTGTLVVLGENDALDFVCDAADFHFAQGSHYGSSADRSLDCSESVKIEAAAPLSFTEIGLGLGILAPGAGTLQLGGAGVGGHAVRASAASRAAPVFRAIRTRVKRAGVVAVTLHLNGAAARTYRRRHRLIVRARETFTPTHGAAIIKLATIALRAPTPTLAQQCTSTPRLRRTRTCQALTRRRHRK